MIWAKKTLNCRQVTIPHADITAIISNYNSGKRPVMLVSVYIFYVLNQREKGFRQLISRLRLIQEAYQLEKDLDQKLELTVTGDFNR